jgi:hypothetical protein
MITAAAALAALLQAAGPSPATLDLEAAYIGWTRCLGAQQRLAEPEVPARHVARTAVRACEPLQRELVAAHEAWLGESKPGERERARARRDLAGLIRDVRANVLRVVREMRSLPPHR